MTAMERPSGDQRGAKTGSEPDTRESLRVLRSKTWTNIFSGWRLSLLLKASAPPSGDQEGSVSRDWAEVIGWGELPSADIRKTFQGFPGLAAEKAMVLPSGDQWGREARWGG